MSNDSCTELFRNQIKLYLLRWLPGAVTKNSINMKIALSQESLVEIDPTLCQNVPCMKPY